MISAQSQQATSKPSKPTVSRFEVWLVFQPGAKCGRVIVADGHEKFRLSKERFKVSLCCSPFVDCARGRASLSRLCLLMPSKVLCHTLVC